MRNVSDKSCSENQNIFYVKYFFPRNHVLNEIMGKKSKARQATDDNIVWPMHIECWVTGVQTHTQNI